MALLTCPSREWASLAKCVLPVSCCQGAGDARVASARFTGCFVFRIVSNPQVITQKIIIVHFPNILFGCLLCAGSHEGLCQLSPFFLSPTPGCDSLARNEWVRFPHLACKETETQGFTVCFFFKSPVYRRPAVYSCTHVTWQAHWWVREEQDGVTASQELMFSQRRQI